MLLMTQLDVSIRGESMPFPTRCLVLMKTHFGERRPSSPASASWPLLGSFFGRKTRRSGPSAPRLASRGRPVLRCETKLRRLAPEHAKGYYNRIHFEHKAMMEKKW